MHLNPVITQLMSGRRLMQSHTIKDSDRNTQLFTTIVICRCACKYLMLPCITWTESNIEFLYLVVLRQQTVDVHV